MNKTKLKGFTPILIVLALLLSGLIAYFGYYFFIKDPVTPVLDIEPLSQNNPVVGIQINTCCSCPTRVDKAKIGTDGWVLYEKGRDYSNVIPVKCGSVACSPCPPLVE